MSGPQIRFGGRRVRVMLSSTALVSFLSVWRAAGLVIAQLGVGAWFVAGVTAAAVGGVAPWIVLAAAVLGSFVRAADAESWALLVPGGLPGRAEIGLGETAGRLAVSLVLVERLFFAALACAIAAHYGGAFVVMTIARRPLGEVTGLE